ncbi:MAG: FkbM family methyltransferase [Nitrososphaerota archaeon]|nr:FkbM family methyltransferase [Nitrososphaerota archaeon]
MHEDDIVVEVGANTGGSTILLSKLAKIVYSFEPSKINFTLLRVNTKSHPNIKIFNLALGREKGNASLMMQDRNRTPKVATMKGLLGARYGDFEVARIEPLDSIPFEQKPTKLILDCEGFEVEVLEGARNTISSLTGVMIETHNLSDGTRTIDSVRQELSRYASLFDIDDTFVDFEGMNWIVATAKCNVKDKFSPSRNSSSVKN